MFKKKKGALFIIVIVVILLTLLTVILRKYVISHKSKTFDIETLRSQSIKYYPEDDLKILDFIDITFLFGYEGRNDENSLFLANVDSEVLEKEDMSIIVVMNTYDATYYYDIFESYKDSMLNSLENENIIKLFNNCIIRKGNDFVYFILGNNPKEKEKDILLQYK